MKLWDELCGIPVGLCGNRSDHAPHMVPESTVGAFWCGADQSTRLPYAAEQRRAGLILSPKSDI